MDFVVNKRKWVNGNNNNFSPLMKTRGHSQLLNGKGNMCCLGFCLLQLGIPKKELKELGDPFEITIKGENLTNIFTKKGENTKLTKKAIDINDDTNTTQDQKIKKLTSLFKKYRHTITFK